MWIGGAYEQCCYFDSMYEICNILLFKEHLFCMVKYGYVNTPEISVYKGRHLLAA